MDKELRQVKSFSELTDKSTPSSQTNYNDGVVSITSDATQKEAQMQAVMQNTGVALTDPYLAMDGTFDLVKFPPNADKPFWKVTFTRKGQDYQFSYFCVPHVHKEFMEEIEARHKTYEEEMSKGKEWIGHEISMPPYIAQMTEIQCGFRHGSDPFKEYIAKDPNYDFFWIDKNEMQRWKSKGQKRKKR